MNNNASFSRANGEIGEQTAARFLKSRKYEIVEQNFHSRYGEIDIIAKNSEYIVFVEVKARSGSYCGNPREAVDLRKQQKIIKTAYSFLMKNPCELQPRFDVIEVYIKSKSEPKPIKLTHLKNAFELSGDEDFALL